MPLQAVAQTPQRSRTPSGVVSPQNVADPLKMSMILTSTAATRSVKMTGRASATNTFAPAVAPAVALRL